jgi:uncharacterized protein (TIGR03437 family)
MRPFVLFATFLLAATLQGQVLPPGVLYSTVVPNSGSDQFPHFPSQVNAIATDAAGNTYVAGYGSGFMGTLGVFQRSHVPGSCDFGFGHTGPCPDAIIAKFDPTGTLVFLTYLGGSKTNIAQSIAVDSKGDIYVGGQTNSKDFPLAGTPYRPVLTNEGTFVAKISGDGTKLIWSTLLNDTLQQMAGAPDGSLDCLIQVIVPGKQNTASLLKLTSDGSFAGTFNVPANSQSVAVNASGSVFVGGYTGGQDAIATPGAWQTTLAGDFDGFIGAVNASYTGFEWLTYVGGSDTDFLYHLFTDTRGGVWATGTTGSTDFPILAGALQRKLGSGTTGFLVHIAEDGTKALASTYLPGMLSSFSTDSSGDVLFSSITPNSFQATPASQWPCVQSGKNQLSGFLGKIDSAAQKLQWDTATGPSVPPGVVAADKNGNVLVAGTDIDGDIVLSALVPAPIAPRLVEGCIGQAASPYSPGPLAPGEVFSIYNAGFGPEQGVGAQPSGGKFPTEVAGVQVTIENVPVPLLYVSSAQINAVAPYLLAGRSAAHVKIVMPSGASNEVVLGVSQAAPEIFAIPSGSKDWAYTAAILNQDGTVNSPEHPAHVGDFLAMFVSGVGQVSPPGIDGAIADSAGGTPVLPISVAVGSAGIPVNANVTYAGNAPGLITGVAQVNFQMPDVNPVGTSPFFAFVNLYVGATLNSGDSLAIWFE